jgi:peptide/nickel transport system permease protein
MTGSATPVPTGLFRRRARTGHTSSLYVGGTIAFLLIAATLLSVAVHIGDPNATDLTGRLHSPDAGHLAGTDELGRDILARLVRGLRWSLGIGTMATAIAVAIGTAIGTAVGTLGAWRRGIVRAILVRATDIGISFPFLVIAVVIVAVVGHGFWPLTLTLGVVAWPTMARVVYAQARTLC